MDRTENLLRRDSILETEKIFGNKHHSQFNESEETVMLLKFMMDNKEKKNYLQSIGDTYWGISWNEFINLIESIGFKAALKYDIKHEDNIDEAILYYHPTKGLVIWATSYWNKKSINGGTMYGEVYLQEDNWKDISKVLTSSHGSFSYYDNENKVEKFKEQVDFSFDVREGLLHNINKVEKVTLYAPIWKERHFLYLTDYIENKKEGYDYKEITRNKIKMCPKEFQKIVGNIF